MNLRALQFRIAALFLCVACGITAPLSAETIRIATFNASLSRNGPGVLLAGLRKGDSPQIAAVAEIIQRVRPEIILINEFDFDAEQLAAAAFIEFLRQDGAATTGIDYPFSFSAAPNTGRASGLDLNGDGKLNGPDDAFGYGQFHGQYGMLVLSQFPIVESQIRTFAEMLWAEFPGADMPRNLDGSAFPSAEAQKAMRLSSKSHWDVPIEVNGRFLHLFASHPTPPVFDGPEDRNGKRNGDEIRFWVQYLDGAAPKDDQNRTAPRAAQPFVVLGDLNADPKDGDGQHRAINALLNHPLVTDPRPESLGAKTASQTQAGFNARHATPANLDTADWNDKRGPGNLRVDYVLPARDLTVSGSGVFWPAPDDPLFALIGKGKPVSSDHRLVWVDIEW